MSETCTRLEFWRQMMGWTYEELAERLGVKTQSAHRYCLPAGHKNHRRPQEPAATQLRRLSGGAVHAGNFADIVTISAQGEAA